MYKPFTSEKREEKDIPLLNNQYKRRIKDAVGTAVRSSRLYYKFHFQFCLVLKLKFLFWPFRIEIAP